MKFSVLSFGALALAAGMSAASLCSPSPGTWCEATVGNGDAGPLPAVAEATVGTGTLSNIIGNIVSGTGGADMYSIWITDPAQFSAVLGSYTASGFTSETNAALYLFDSTGHGVEAAPEGTSLAGFNGAAGLYYIDIAPNGNAADYVVNGSPFSVFPTLAAGQDSVPVAGAGAIDSYSKLGCGTACAGVYEVNITGAQYSNAPEPAELSLMGMAVVGVGVVRRVRRKA